MPKYESYHNDEFLIGLIILTIVSFSLVIFSGCTSTTVSVIECHPVLDTLPPYTDTITWTPPQCVDYMERGR